MRNFFFLIDIKKKKRSILHNKKKILIKEHTLLEHDYCLYNRFTIIYGLLKREKKIKKEF